MSKQISFVKQSNLHNLSKDISNTCSETGESVQRFYNSLISRPTRNKTLHQHRAKRKITPLSSVKDNVTRKEAFFAATTGNLNTLSAYLKNSGDPNACDEHSWSLLMCASCAGNFDCVEFLLSRGANVEHRDKKGRNAYSVTKSYQIQALLTKKQTECKDDRTKQKHYESSDKNVNCPECGITYKLSKELEHQTSIVHQISKPATAAVTHYVIPPCNVGYKMLVNLGWDEQSGGLGPSRSGRLQPVKASMKQDRSGLGVKSSRSQSGNRLSNGVIVNTRGERRQSETKRRREEKAKEIQFRREFYD